MAKRVTLRTTELFTAPPPPALIEGLITRHGVVGISADPGVGKSFFAMEIARCVAMNDPLFGRYKVKRRGSTLFVGQDCDMLEYAQQARKVLQRYERPFHEIQWYIHKNLDLKRSKDVAQLIAIANSVPDPSFDPEVPVDWNVIPPDDNPNAAQIDCTWEPVYGSPNGVAMIVLDSARDLHTANENDNGEMSQVYTNLRTVARETKSAVVVLHHHSYATETNPNGRFRGASSQYAALSGHLELSGQGSEKTLRIKKFRGIRPKDFKFSLFTSETEARFEFVNEIERKTGAPRTGEEPPTVEQEVHEFVMALDGPSFETGQVVNFLVETKKMAKESAQALASKLCRNLESKGHITSLMRGTWTT